MVISTGAPFYSSKKLLIQVLVSTLYGVLAFIYLFYSEFGTMPQAPEQLDTLSFFILSSWVIFAILSLTARGLNRVWPWVVGTAGRFTAQFFINTLITLVLLWLSARLFILIKYPNQTLPGFLQDKWDVALKFGIIFIVTNLIFVLVDLYQYSFTRYIEANIESEKMVRQRLKLQYDILKSQLSPHYLFNTLNTIASLIHRDAQTTEGFIRKFAQTFAYILKSHQKDLVTVEEELRFIKAYIFLLQIRFENALEVTINIPEPIQSTFIPPMTLQLLVENAVKHNEFSDEKPLHIAIEGNGNPYITVKNNFERKAGFIEVDKQLVKKPVRHVSHKVGLENIKKRYTYFSDKEVIISRDQAFTVSLPLIHQQMQQEKIRLL